MLEINLPDKDFRFTGSILVCRHQIYIYARKSISVAIIRLPCGNEITAPIRDVFRQLRFDPTWEGNYRGYYTPANRTPVFFLNADGVPVFWIEQQEDYRLHSMHTIPHWRRVSHVL